jgi:hypothetical protein
MSTKRIWRWGRALPPVAPRTIGEGVTGCHAAPHLEADGDGARSGRRRSRGHPRRSGAEEILSTGAAVRAPRLRHHADLLHQRRAPHRAHVTRPSSPTRWRVSGAIAVIPPSSSPASTSTARRSLKRLRPRRPPAGAGGSRQPNLSRHLGPMRHHHDPIHPHHGRTPPPSRPRILTTLNDKATSTSTAIAACTVTGCERLLTEKELVNGSLSVHQMRADAGGRAPTPTTSSA